jgi:MFS family permease
VSRVRHFRDATFRSFRTRNFRLFFGGQIVSQVGNWMTLVTQTLLVLDLTDSGVALGILGAAHFGPILVLGPWTGLVADRSDKRRLLITVQVLAMAQSFALAALAFRADPPIIAVYAVALLGGLTVAFDNPARRAFVTEMVPRDDIPNAVSLNSALMTASRILGPALAGLAVATIGYGWAFVADGLSYFAVLAAFGLMRPAELHRGGPAPRGKGQVREGFRYARANPNVWVPLAMTAVVGTLSYNFQVVFPLFATRDLGGAAATFTVLFSVMSAGAFVGALAVARRTHVSLRTVALASIGFGVPMAVMVPVPNLTLALPVAFAVGLGSTSFVTASTAIVQTGSSQEMRGRVLALQAMVFLGSTPIGGPILGWISDTWGARWGLAVGAAAALGAGAWGLSVARRHAPPVSPAGSPPDPRPS